MATTEMPRRRLTRRPMALIALVLCVIVVFPTATTAATYRVRARGNNVWDPNFRHILKGDRIVWRNPTSQVHDVTSIGSKWSMRVRLQPGERTRKRFKRTGTFRYRCRLHSRMETQDDGTRKCEGMCGEIHVARS